MYVVKKHFNTVNRHLKPGDPVSEADHLEPHTVETLKSGGFIGAETPEAEKFDVIEEPNNGEHPLSE
jgi:hypothetical protein